MARLPTVEKWFFANYGQVADDSTRQRIKSSKDVGELVFNPVQLIRSYTYRKVKDLW